MQNQRHCVQSVQLRFLLHCGDEKRLPPLLARWRQGSRFASWVALACSVQSFDCANSGQAAASAELRRTTALHAVEKRHPFEIEGLVNGAGSGLFHSEQGSWVNLFGSADFKFLRGPAR